MNKDKVNEVLVNQELDKLENAFPDVVDRTKTRKQRYDELYEIMEKLGGLL